MNDDERELAVNCFGYGRWDAPYWFIGPEQGKSKLGDKEISERARAFRKLSQDGLCDCRDFHEEIRDHRWHGTPSKLQGTWKSMILLLMASQQRSIANDARREYQRDHWGRSSGDTCIVELSGLPAKNLSESNARDRALSDTERRESEQIRSDRVEFIRRKMLQYKPKFVVIYGKGQFRYWKKLADEIAQEGATTIRFAKHPTDFFEKGQSKNEYYESLGNDLREII